MSPSCRRSLSALLLPLQMLACAPAAAAMALAHIAPASAYGMRCIATPSTCSRLARWNMRATLDRSFCNAGHLGTKESTDAVSARSGGVITLLRSHSRHFLGANQPVRPCARHASAHRLRMSASPNSAETDTDFTLDDDFPIDYRTPEHLWERQPTPVFDYPEEGDWLAEAIALVQENNGKIMPLVAEICTRPFFRYYPVDLLASCGYTPSRESPCELDACEIEPHEPIPPRMVERDEDEYEFELDSWARWDMPSDFTEYYDLVANPESNTAYNGTLVWRFIHHKICFQKRMDQKVNFWKRDFNRGVSGIHSSVSANIISDIRAAEGDEAALVEYRRRLRDMPGAIQNLYFTYLLTLCAIEALKPRLEVCSFLGDKRAPDIMKKLLEVDIYNHPSIQRAASELREHANSSNAAAWKMRLRTRDLLGLCVFPSFKFRQIRPVLDARASQVMNCVQCNLCRLHGKVLCLGFAAILQVLLGNKGRGEEDCDENPDPYSLTRVEVGAVLTVAGKLASAIEQVEQLRALDEA